MSISLGNLLQTFPIGHFTQESKGHTSKRCPVAQVQPRWRVASSLAVRCQLLVTGGGLLPR